MPNPQVGQRYLEVAQRVLEVAQAIQLHLAEGVLEATGVADSLRCEARGA
ncbi:hypothetical protein ABZ851_00525 [Streptomyces sp. NPDC047049]